MLLLVKPLLMIPPSANIDATDAMISTSLSNESNTNDANDASDNSNASDASDARIS